MADGREPFGLAMIVCDAVHIDPWNGKRSLLGLFSGFVSPTFPLTIPALSVYAALTECVGKTSLTLRIVDANEQRVPIYEEKGEVECDDPLAVLDAEFKIVGVQIPHPGEYRIQLFASGTPIMERRILAAQRPKKEEGQ